MALHAEAGSSTPTQRGRVTSGDEPAVRAQPHPRVSVCDLEELTADTARYENAGLSTFYCAWERFTDKKQWVLHEHNCSNSWVSWFPGEKGDEPNLVKAVNDILQVDDRYLVRVKTLHGEHGLTIYGDSYVRKK